MISIAAGAARERKVALAAIHTACTLGLVTGFALLLLPACGVILSTHSRIERPDRAQETVESSTQRVRETETPRLRVSGLEVHGDRVAGRLVTSGLCTTERLDQIDLAIPYDVTWTTTDNTGKTVPDRMSSYVFWELVLGLPALGIGGFCAVRGCSSNPEGANASQITGGIVAILGGLLALGGAIDGIASLAVSYDQVEHKKTQRTAIVRPAEPCNARPEANEKGRIAFGADQVDFATDGTGRFDTAIGPVSANALREWGRKAHVRLERGTIAEIEIEQTALERLAALAEGEALKYPPRLETRATFRDGEGELENVLEAGEIAALELRVTNSGRGIATEVTASLAPTPAVESEPAKLGDIAPGRTAEARIEIRGRDELRSGKARLRVTITEARGFPPPPIDVEVRTDRRHSPKLTFTGQKTLDGQVGQQSGNGDGRPQAGEQIELRGVLTNTGDGTLRAAEAELVADRPGALVQGGRVPLPMMPPGRSREIGFIVALPALPQPPRQARFKLLVRARSGAPISELPIEFDVLPGASAETIKIADAASNGSLALAGHVLAVFPIEIVLSRQPSDRELTSLNQLYSSRLVEAGLRLIPADDLRRRLVKQKAESYKSCYDSACQIQLGKELAASGVVRTSIAPLGRECVVSASVFDLKTETTIVSRSQRTGCSLRELGDALESVARQLAL